MRKPEPKKEDEISSIPSKEKEYAQEIAGKVNYLFENFRKPDGHKYTFKEIEELTHGDITSSWISKLASGQSSRPGLPALRALTKIFAVDPGFWFKELDDWIKDREEAEYSGEAAVKRIALRAKNLPPEVRNMLEDMIDSYEKRFNSTAENK